MKTVLQSLTRHDRGFGSLINFDDNSEFPTDFKDNFMKNPQNKENLNHFLAKKFLEIHNTGITVVITIENRILKMTPHQGKTQLLAPVQLRRPSRSWSGICYNVYWPELKLLLLQLLIKTFFVAFGLPSFRGKLLFKSVCMVWN